MRKFFLTLAAVAVTVTAAMLAPSNASAAAVVAPSAMQPAIADAVMVDNVAWVRRCHHHWRTSNHHCRPVWVPGHRHHRHHHRHRGHRH